MRTDDLDSALGIHSDSVTDSKGVSVEWPLLNPDWLLSSRLFCERKEETWLNTTHFDFAMKGLRDTGL